ncbi:MAG: serine kinase [Synergistaceae bacterium]|nr:serine kinase [Synergistaceae bacterium]
MASVRIDDLCAEIEAEVYVQGDMSREVARAAVGDLLSFVMGSGAEGAAWITVQTHLNVAAVAVLKDIPIIIIASGRVPANDLTERCRVEGISLVGAKSSIFDICVKLGRLGLRG